MRQRMDIISAAGSLSIRRQCELLGVPRSTFYFSPKGESPENLMLMDINGQVLDGTPVLRSAAPSGPS